jgi:peroxiredoxin
MNLFSVLALPAWLAIIGICWLGWQLLLQNGRLLLRLEELEKRLDELEFGTQEQEPCSSPDLRDEESLAEKPQAPGHKSEADQSRADTAATANGRSARFSNRSLARSRLKRDGLKAGTVAPEFSLPRLDGHGDLSLSELRGRPVLLVFSSPGCGPCNALAPELEKFYRAHPELAVVMISKGEPKENRAKVKEHRLSFPVVLQQQWEISRRYAMFATPIAYLIDEQGIISHDVAVGVEPILGLLHGVVPGVSNEGALAPARAGSWRRG